MTARICALVLVGLGPTVSLGQGFSQPAGLPPRLSPAQIIPAPFGPTPGVLPGLRSPLAFVPPIAPVPPLGLLPYPGYGFFPGYGGLYGGGLYGGGLYGNGFYGFAPPLYTLPTVGFAPAALAPPALQGTSPLPPSETGLTVDSAAVAELTIEFPEEVELKVDGKTVTGSGKTRTITTRGLKPGETEKVSVSATWTNDGKSYSWERDLTLGRGDRSRLTVARGTPVND